MKSIKHKNSLKGVCISPLLLYASVLLAFGSGCNKTTQYRATNSSSSSSVYSQEEERAFAQDAAETDNQADAMATQGQIQPQNNKVHSLAKVALVALTAAAMPTAGAEDMVENGTDANHSLQTSFSCTCHFGGVSEGIGEGLGGRGRVGFKTFDSNSNGKNFFDNLSEALTAAAGSASAAMEALKNTLTAVSYVPTICIAGLGVGAGVTATMIGTKAAEKAGGPNWMSPVAGIATGGLATGATIAGTAIGWIPAAAAVGVGTGTTGVIVYKGIKAGTELWVKRNRTSR